MKQANLMLGALLLVLGGGGACLVLTRASSRASRPSLEREAQVASDGAAEAPAPKTLEAALLESPPWRDDARNSSDENQGRGEGLERDELFADSPSPPEPGTYDGEFIRDFYDNGNLLFEAQQTLRHDGIWVVDGLWTSWHENGQKQESGSYAKEVEVGDWKWWDENGQLIALGNFVEGKREGAWTFWYSNGIKQMDARYEGGVGSGNWTLYFDDGSRWAQGQYSDGEISGYWTIWDEFGEVNLERSGMYEHGVRVSD